MTTINTKFKEILTELATLRQRAPAAGRAATIEFAKLCGKLGRTTIIIPKRTGNLRSTSRAEIEENSIKFVTGGIKGNPTRKGVKSKEVDYAFYVNNGTSRQPGQFFMERVVSLASTKSKEIYAKILESWLRHTK